jgi:hypothetical protein
MIEITADDIALLNDEDLRSLVGRLCESEMRQREISPSCVTWGGNQTAADGGLDVHVALPSNVGIQGFIPRPNTGFQVKAEEIPPAKVLSEMRPNGVLRSSIRELAEQSGAYIIVSSKSSVSDLALQNRREAMAQAVSELPDAKALQLDFYDRRRIETWLRDHTGTVLWVREKIGKPLQGWSGYAAWSYAPGGPGSEYLLDDELRITTYKQTAKPGLSALEGIRSIRDILRKSQGIARLIGMSGVGKTRLVQALFDDRVGENSLDPALAVYTNFTDAPKPQPIALVSELINTHKKAVLVVDNCPPELHQRLSEACRSDGSLLRLITVEYDIREDQAEATDVFVLEVASVSLTENLVRQRFPGLSPVNARRIAEFSGGNARIAVALAGQIDKEESISQLSGQELFARLFQQRHQHDEALFSAAQALSLVYSFEGENVSGEEKAELSPLGALMGKNALEMFKHSAELERRGLVQRRGPWRAVLPPAIANRLAATALQNIPPTAVQDCFVRGGRERLLKSFSRRLGYLNDSEQARSIASNWLGLGGMLEDPAELNDLGQSIFSSIAPASPESALAALERVLLEPKADEAVSNCKRHLRLIRSLAYEGTLFERCIALIVKILESGNVDNDNEDGRQIFVSLFPIYFSGTHATIEQRFAIIKSLTLSDDPKRRVLGLSALKTALEAVHFGPGWDFEFGAHSRDYGWWPRTAKDWKQWFGQGLSLVQELACSDKPSALKARNALADQFRGLWSAAQMYDDLERVCRSISEKGFWPEGWIAVRQTIHYDSNGMTPEVAARLASLEADLRPKDLLQKVRSIVLQQGVLYIGVDSTVDGSTDVLKSLEQVQTVAGELGRAVAADQGALAALLPELFLVNSEQLSTFGGGLAEAAKEPGAIWNQLAAQLDETPKDMQHIQVIYGFLHALNIKDPYLATSLLDNAVENEVLGPWFPILQTTAVIDRKAVDRLIRSLDAGKAGIRVYRSLVGGGATHQIPGSDFNKLLIRIAREPGGLDIAIEILSMRISFAANRSSPSELIDIGCELLRRLTFTRRSRTDDYRLGFVAKNCLIGGKGAAAVKVICQNLKDAVSKSETYPFYQADLLNILFSAQPLAALDGMCGGSQTELDLGVSILDQASQLRRNPFDAIPEPDLLTWCDQQPNIRYPAIASGVTPLQWSAEAGQTRWTNIARQLIDRAPDRVAVLKRFTDEFIPGAWVGTRTSIIESNARLLDELSGYSEPALVEFIAREKSKLTQAVQTEKLAQATQRELESRAIIEGERYDRFE